MLGSRPEIEYAALLQARRHDPRRVRFAFGQAQACAQLADNHAFFCAHRPGFVGRHEAQIGALVHGCTEEGAALLALGHARAGLPGQSHDPLTIIGKRLAQGLPVFLTALRRPDGAAALVKRRVLFKQALDFLARLAEDLAALRRPGHGRGNTDGGRGHGDLGEDALLQVKKLIEALRRKDRPQENARMRAADAVDAAMPLDKAHWIPRHVEIDDMTALLEVHTLGQHVGRNEDVVEIGVLTRQCLAGNRRESVAGFLPRDFAEIVAAGNGHHPPR